MRVVVETPEPRAGLDGAVAKQFAEIQRQLMGMVAVQQTQQTTLRREVVDALASQQDRLISAVERLMSAMHKSVKTSEASDGMVAAVRDLRASLAALPAAVRDAMPRRQPSASLPAASTLTSSKITVQMPAGLLGRLDALEMALLSGMRRFRTRTFGSNY